MPKIKLKESSGKKEYHSGDLNIFLGTPVEVSQETADRLLKTFPEWFAIIGSVPVPQVKAMKPNIDKSMKSGKNK